ncbi:MAG: redoxin family protein [Rickettsiales bacterium]
MIKNKKIFHFILLVIIVLVLYLMLSSRHEKYKIGALVGSQVPEFNLALLDEKSNFTNQKLKELNTEYKLLNFFASWCSTCMLEHDDLLTLSNRKDIKIIGVVWRDSPKSSKNWLEKHGDPYDLLLFDKSGSSKMQFGLIGVPESFLIDGNNNIIAHYRGPINLAQLNGFLDNKIKLIQ